MQDDSAPKSVGQKLAGVLSLCALFGLMASMWLIKGAGPHWLLTLPALITLPVFAEIPHVSGGAIPLS